MAAIRLWSVVDVRCRPGAPPERFGLEVGTDEAWLEQYAWDDEPTAACRACGERVAHYWERFRDGWVLCPHHIELEDSDATRQD